MRKRGFPALAVAVVLSVAVGCSGSSGGTKTTSGSTPTSSPSQSQSPTALSLAKAKALAAAGVLTTADLPGYASKPQTHDATDDATEAMVQHCLGLPTQNYLTRNFGTAFTKGADEIDSSVDVARSVADGQAELQAARGANASGCFTQVLRTLLQKSGLQVKTITASPVSVTVPNSDGAFAYVLSITATGNGRTVRLRGYEVGVLVGQVEIAVTSDSIGGGIVALPLIKSLATKATERVRAAY